MDIQKEREAFDAWHYEQYLLENPNIDISNAKYIYDYAHKNALVCQLKESHFTAWQAAKAQAVPEKTVKLHLVWNENKDECVGFLDSKDARYTATGDYRGMFGVTALGDYFRDLNDERNEFETQIVMIEAQEPAND